jgi:NADH:ubiquinone oxidoreductase subunit 3 (subunit A)
VPDLLFVVITIVFFALAGLYVTACEHLVGRERPDTGSLDRSESGTLTQSH